MKSDPFNLPPHLQAQRIKDRRMARNWLATHAGRLGVSQDDILNAIKRGWIREFIERITRDDFRFRILFPRALDRQSRKAA